MPLIILSGFPASGKTHRADQLRSFFESKLSDAAAQLKQSADDATTTAPSADQGEDARRANEKAHTERVARMTVHHISDDVLDVPRSVYEASRDEKIARAAFYSAIKRNLSRDAIVIADGLNYIKGYRYQLYCDSKEARTPSCVVHVGTPVRQCLKRNSDRLASDDGRAYSASCFDNLVFRYEEPNGMSRWDSPLFTVLSEDEHPPYEQIWEALVGSTGQAKAVRPNQVTVLAAPAQQDALYVLDRQTTEIVNAILQWQEQYPGEPDGAVPIPGLDETIRLPSHMDARPVKSPQLQRLRRQFLTMNRQHPPDQSRIRHLFVNYLNDWFKGS